VSVFNGSFDDYKAKLRDEFSGGNLLTEKRKAARKNGKNVEPEPEPVAAPVSPPKPPGKIMMDNAFMKEVSAVSDAQAAADRPPPSTSKFVPPHLRARQAAAEAGENADDAWDE
jgi:ATP-binding cassette subfamily F protein 2